MIVLEIKCKDNESMVEKRDEFCRALVGSPRFKDSEIAVCDKEENSFVLIVGNNNENNISYVVNSNRLMRPKE